MKKFISITAIITFISLGCAIISFFIFDIHKFARHLDSSDRIKIAFGFQSPPFAYNIFDFIEPFDLYEEDMVIEQRIEHLSDKIEEGADRLSEYTEEKVEAVTENIDRAAESFVDNIENSVGHITEKYLGNRLKDIVDLSLEFAGVKDGYMDRASILRNSTRFAITDQKIINVETIKSFHIDIKDTDIILGKSKTKDAQIYLMEKKFRPSLCELNINSDSDTVDLKIEDKGIRRHTAVLYLLIPDNLGGDIHINTTDGDVISINQDIFLSITAKDSDIIVSQKKSGDLSIHSKFGDIILSLGKEIDAKISAKAKDGSIIGLGAIKDKNNQNMIEKTFGSGKASIDLLTEDGSIIID